MSTEITIVKLSESRLADLAKLFKLVFNVEHSIEYLKRKYTPSNSLPSYSGFFAYVNSEPVAFCGGIPCNMSYNNYTFKGMQFCDTMTLQNWSGKGIFHKISKSLEQYALNHNIVFHYAFLNENSYWAYKKKLDWEIVGSMRRYTIKGSNITWYKLFSKIKPMERWHNSYIRKKLAKHLSTSIYENKPITKNMCYIVKDDDYFNGLPSNHYFLDIDGNSIWLKLKNEAHLGNVNITSGTNVTELLNSLKLILKELGIQKLYIQFLEGTPSQIQMEKSIKSLDSWNIGAKSFDDRIPTKNLNLVYGDIDTFI